MKTIIETERLLLREMVAEDAEAMFEMDSDAEVHKYLGNNPVKDIEEIHKVIQFVQQQYQDNGIGRWSVVEKSTGLFIGWSGLKLVKEPLNNHTNFFDLGYRFNPKAWGKGYATETGKASLEYGFKIFNPNEIYGIADIHNFNSRNVLQKCGLTYVEQFDWDGQLHDWLKITKEEWTSQNKI